MWIGLALLTALFESLKDLWAKRLLSDQWDFLILAWGVHAGAAAFLLPVGLLHKIPPFPLEGIPVLVIVSMANAVVVVLYMFALRYGELSAVIPLLTLTPAFMLLSSPLLLNEVPSSQGIIGVVVIVIGAYLLHMPNRWSAWRQPFVLVFQHPAARAMLLIAVVWSVTGNLDKIGVQYASPIGWGVLTNGGIAVLLTPVVWTRWRKSRNFGIWLSQGWKVLVLGFCAAMVTWTQMTAITMTLVPYVIAIKRLSILLSVFWGGVVLRESQFRQRMVAATLMVIGAVIVTLS